MDLKAMRDVAVEKLAAYKLEARQIGFEQAALDSRKEALKDAIREGEQIIERLDSFLSVEEFIAGEWDFVTHPTRVHGKVEEV